jgi:basic amino acid/polyamine antiporter, APA family
VTRFGRQSAGDLGRMRVARGLGVPALFAIGLSAAASSIYLTLGIVAGDALGLTPVVFLAAGVFFLITTLTYLEGSSLHPERGGASTFARYAFNELWSFVAGWAIILDYLIVIAACAFLVSGYITAFWSHGGGAGLEVGVAAVVIGLVAWLNIRGVTAERLGAVLRVGLGNLVVLTAVVVIGLAMDFDPGQVADSVQLGSAPEWDELVFAAVVASFAVTGIEAASGLAAEIRVEKGGLKRLAIAAAVGALVIFVGIPAVAVMTLPVENGSTPLGSTWQEAPVLGIVSAWSPESLSDAFRWLVGGFAAVVLVQAANGNMIGLSRLTYELATNRQVPSLVGRLHPVYSTPYIAVALASIIALALSVPDLEFLAGIFAFGAMLALTIAHLSVIALRFREPDLERGFRVPLSVSVRGTPVPLPAVLGAAVGAAAWVSVIVLHEGARLVGGVWMLGGLLLYVAYRRSQGKPLSKRFTIPAAVLQEREAVEYGSILVPVFGDPIDDDIMGTAGRLAAEEGEEGAAPVIEALYVLEIPMSLPIDARVPEERMTAARKALARAKEVGEEYAGVEVATATVRGRQAGGAIVDEARRRGVEAIVLAAEEPTRMRGGGRLGGRGGPRERFVGETTKYVVEKAPCRVIVTAAPAEDGDGEPQLREGVAP